MSPANRSYNVRAVERVCRILDIVQDQVGGVGLADVAETSELPKTSAFRYLWTLEHNGYVRRDAAGNYRPGPGISAAAPRRMEVLLAAAQPWIDQVRDETAETVSLGVLDGHQVVYHAVAESPRALRVSEQVGAREPVHSTALGKALVARLPDETVRRILDAHGMAAITPQTITDVDTFLGELNRVRRTGYAVNNRENEQDGRCIGVAIDGVGVPAAISLSAPITRLPMSGTPRIAKLLHAAAQRIAVEVSGSRR